MNQNKIYTSEEILAADDLYDIQEQVGSFGNSIKYRMTAAELGWLDFVRGRYSIADYIDNNLEDDIVTLDDGLSQALEDDCAGWGKATCLADDTALQKLFFWCYSEPADWSEEA